MNVDVIPLDPFGFSLVAIMQHTYRGIGNYLYWQGDMNHENSWVPPLPFSKFQINDGAIRFSNSLSSQTIPTANVVVIRKHLKPIRRFSFIAMDGDRGSKLIFTPIFDRLFSEMIQQRFSNIQIQYNDGWWDFSDKEDRERHNLPKRVSG